MELLSAFERPGAADVDLERLARTRLRLLDSTFEGIYQTDLQGRCTFMNRSACSMLGYHFGEALGQNINDLHLDKSAPGFVPGSFDIGGPVDPLAREARQDIFIRKDGFKFPVERCSLPFFDNRAHQGTVVTFREISDRVRAERRLKAQYEVSLALESTKPIETLIPVLLQAIGESLEFAWGGFWQVDEQAGVLRFSEAWRQAGLECATFEQSCRATELRSGQCVLGKVWKSGGAVWLPELGPADDHRGRQAREAGFVSGFAFAIQAPQGVFGVLEFLVRQRTPADRDLLGILGLLGKSIGHAIEHKRSESVRTRLAAILDAAADFVGLVMDPEATIISIGRAAETIFGFTPDELVGKPLSLLLPECRRYLEENGWPNDMAPVPIRIPGQRRNQDPITLEVSVGGCSGEGSQVFAVVIRDITDLTHREETFARQSEDLRCSEQALRQQTRLVTSIITSMADGVIAADQNRDILLYNPAATDLLGEDFIASYSDDEAIASSGVRLFLPDGQTPLPGDQAPLTRAIHGEIVESEEIFAKTPHRPDGFWLNATARPMHDSDGQLHGAILVLRDITEQKTSREALRNAKDDAESANRAKSEFLSRMSHELRTPMNAILGFAQFLEEDTITPDQRDAVSRILRAARHLLGLINEVLDISRIEAGRLKLSMQRIKPFELLHEALELVSPLAAKRGIEVIPPPKSDAQWVIDADRQMLTQVLVNLLGNAVKYNRERGVVRLSFDAVPGGQLRINIADTGLGMSAAQLKKLFVPFERLGAERSNVEGTGLGLAYSKRMVNAMGGTIGVDSEVARGSTFWVEMSQAVPEKPVKTVSVKPPESPADKQNSFTVGLSKILCIQSDPASFRAVQDVFERLPGYGLVCEQTGKGGLESAVEQTPELVILDLQLPDMDGMDVLKELRNRETTRHTPVVVVSSAFTDKLKQTALDAGAHSCLAKPIQVQSFLDTVACLI